jgi:pilus assembly protein CpaB
LVGAYIVWQRFLQPAPEEIEGAPEPTPVVDLVRVVVVTQPTPRGSILDETILGMIEIPRDVLIEGMFTDMAQVVGRQAKFDLDSGIPLTASMLVDSAEQLSATGSVAALSIPRGKVAVSINIGRFTSVSYAPRAGDHVSVIASMLFIDLDSQFQAALPNHIGGVTGPYVNPETGQGFITIQVTGGTEGSPFLGRTELDPYLNELAYVIQSEAQRPRLVTQTIIYDAEVLRIGEFPLPEEEEKEEEGQAQQEQQADQANQQEGAEAAPPEPKVEPPTIITLIVTPQDAVTLNYLKYTGAQLSLALRATGDDTVTTTEAATLQYLLDVYNIPIPAKLPYGVEPRIDRLPSSPVEVEGAEELP